MSDREPRWPSRTAAYGRQRTRLKAYGRWQPYVDAGPARQHVEWLRSLGIGWQHIADLAGVPRNTVARLLYGDKRSPPSKRIRPETERRLLAVRPDPELIPPRTRINGNGTRRRLRALVAVGWSLNELAKQAGVGSLNRTARGTGPVYAGTAVALRRVYDELWDQEPPMDTPRRRVAAADEAEADTVARDLSAHPDLMKAAVYRDGELYARYGMGFKWEADRG